MSHWFDRYIVGERVEVVERGSRPPRWVGATVASIGPVGHGGAVAMLVRLDETGHIARAEKKGTRPEVIQ
jgi:hypothetical protein